MAKVNKNKVLLTHDEQEPLLITNEITKTSKKNFFAKSIINCKNIEHIYFCYSNEPENKTPLSDLFQLKVNVDNVGPIVFFFDKKLFNREDAVEDIIKLKRLKSNDRKTSIHKVKRLFDILVIYKPILIVYDGTDEDCVLTANDFLYCKTPTLFVQQKLNAYDSIESIDMFVKKEVKEEEGKISSTSSSSNESTKEKVEVEKTKKGKKEKSSVGPGILLAPFKMIGKEKFHFLFMVLSSFIIFFAIDVGLYNCYINNFLFYFFFACGAAGTVLNGFMYFDIFKKYGPKPLLIVLNIICHGLGVVINYFGSKLYFDNVSTMPETIPTPDTLFIYSSAIGAGAILISVLISVVVLTVKNKKQ